MYRERGRDVRWRKRNKHFYEASTYFLVKLSYSSYLNAAVPVPLRLLRPLLRPAPAPAPAQLRRWLRPPSSRVPGHSSIKDAFSGFSKFNLFKTLISLQRCRPNDIPYSGHPGVCFWRGQRRAVHSGMQSRWVPPGRIGVWTRVL